MPGPHASHCAGHRSAQTVRGAPAPEALAVCREGSRAQGKPAQCGVVGVTAKLWMEGQERDERGFQLGP